jgi:hypothetical protein
MAKLPKVVLLINVYKIYLFLSTGKLNAGGNLFELVFGGPRAFQVYLSYSSFVGY